jgi:hypothetical protein
MRESKFTEEQNAMLDRSARASRSASAACQGRVEGACMPHGRTVSSEVGCGALCSRIVRDRGPRGLV